MSEAPKELWADWDYGATDGVCGVHTQKKYASYYEPECPPIRYVRADLIDAEREWVGLTKKEQTAIVNDWKLMSATPERLCRIVEAKLKEKNT